MRNPAQDSTDSDLHGRLEQLTSRFKEAVRSGAAPSLDEFLEGVDAAHRERLRAELQLIKQRFEDKEKESVREIETTSQVGHAPPSRPATPGPGPERIGRFRIVEVLGQGGFGVVYRAQDDQLGRHVALKVPHKHRITTPADAELYLAEARVVANLDHPQIVPVLDVGSTAEVHCYIVCKFIEGTNLSTRLQQNRPAPLQVAHWLALIAEALHHAHKQGMVHRDVKPGNILIGSDGKPYVVDFGLALRDELVGQGPRYAGTPEYMSPEQARGEGHRVDGRSDIFSLGVVLYEALTGRRPFRGGTVEVLLDQVCTLDPKPPRMIEDSIPKELERICLRALAKRATERYSTARDLADDLWNYLSKASPDQFRMSATVMSETAPTMLVKGLAARNETPQPADSDRRPARVIPKGLRSFDEHDADFFLDLLPGPRDRDGFPEAIRFWKTRIEEADPDKTFAVGLIYGPSGCGKSSLVKAGLLPRLAEKIIVVSIEATGGDTEARLLARLRKACPDLPGHLELQQTIAALRRGQGIPAGHKVLIVLDQFEQYLHAQHDLQAAELVPALRQCDGGRLQCVLMVRDDFWMAATRFLRELEVRLVDGQNSAVVDLFPRRHARQVLIAFGRAFGDLPPEPQEISSDHSQFLEACLDMLAEDGKVVCVRLALLAEMIKGKPWVPATLRQLGGATGIGVAFLEDTFSANTSPPQHRFHQAAARAVLAGLLPESGSNIKGRQRTRAELLAASGYAHRPRDFDDLLGILDRDLRLITPNDTAEPSETGATTGSKTDPHEACFQLTHDYLVPSLRGWLTRKQRETSRGRAEIRLLTSHGNWTAPQRAMMNKAALIHGLTVSLAILLIGGIGFGAWQYRQQQERFEARIAARQKDEVKKLDEQREITRRDVNDALQRTGTYIDLGWSQIDDSDVWQGTLRSAEESLRVAQRRLENVSQADTRLANDPAIKELQQQLLAMEARFKEADDGCQLAIDIDRSLENLLEKGVDFSTLAQTAKEFPAALRRRGMNVLETDPAEMAERINKDERLKTSLMVILTAWEFWTTNLSERKHLGEIRAKVAQGTKSNYSNWVIALYVGDAADLVKLAKDKDVSNLPPRVLVLMGIAMQGSHPLGLDKLRSWINKQLWNIPEINRTEAAIAQMKEWQFKHPDEFWLNLQIGTTLMHVKPARDQEALPYLVAAVALRPHHELANYQLGYAYLKLRDQKSRFAAIDNAFRAPPQNAWIRARIGEPA